MTQIISFFSPKTAGASGVSLNAALLHKLLNPSHKIAFIEMAAWSSQACILQPQEAQSWEKIFPFYKTDEWNPALLPRLVCSLGADLFWSPRGQNWPHFNRSKALAFFQLLKNEYDLIVIDLASNAPATWQAFAQQESHAIVGVLTPDPISLEAWQIYEDSSNFKAKTKWLFNQVPSSEKKRLLSKFKTKDAKFLGVLRRDDKRFWRQFYERQPVATQATGKFKKDLEQLIPQLFSA